MGRTRKPCIGCGSRHWDRERDKLCSGCQRELELGRKLREKDDAKIEAGKGVAFLVPPTWWPYYISRVEQGLRGRVKDIGVRMVKLGEALFPKLPSKEGIHYHYAPAVQSLSSEPVTDWKYPVEAPPKAVAAFQNLDAHLRVLINEAWVDGVRQGRDILSELNRGAIGMVEFEEKNEDLDRWLGEIREGVDRDLKRQRERKPE